MRRNIKGIIVIFLSLFLSVCNVWNNNFSVKAQNQKVNKTNNISNSRIKSLEKDKSWNELRILWKKLNNFKTGQDYNKNYAAYKELEKGNLKVDGVLNNLLNSKLITPKEKEFLYRLFLERLNYLEFELGFVTCYKMTSIGSKIAETRGDLEKKYDIIEKLFKEQKINSETFKTTRQTISEDISFIQKNTYGLTENSVSADTIDLLIYLNQ